MTQTPLHFSRVKLRRDVPAAALRTLLVPSEDSARVGAGHRLVWTLFADSPGRDRDFLWREMDGGSYFLLSARPPEDKHGLFEPVECKIFAPVFTAGDRLRFSLRANATVARKVDPTSRRGKPCDVVMDVLFKVPRGERAEARHEAVQTAGVHWLAGQGQRCGFAVSEASDGDGKSGVRVVAYRTLRVDHAGPAARIGVIDVEGQLEVRDPAVFVEALAHGFGRAKAFGCGLMLVQRI